MIIKCAILPVAVVAARPIAPTLQRRMKLSQSTPRIQQPRGGSEVDAANRDQ